MDKQIIHSEQLLPGAESPSYFRKVQHTLPVRLLVSWFLSATKYLPVWFLRLAAWPVVPVFIMFNFLNFRAILANLRRIKPGLGRSAYFFMAFNVFRNYAYYLIDLFYLSHDPRRIEEYDINVKGLDNLRKTSSKGRGVILLTTHMGNWEVGGLKLSSLGRDIASEIHIVYSPDSLSLLENQRKFIRQVDTIKEVPLKEGEFSSLRLLRLLQEGKMIALQGDRLTFDRGVKMPFFGSPALFPKGPMKLAALTGSIILPVFIPLSGYKSYDLIIEEPIEFEKNEDLDDEIGKNPGKIIKILEKYISRYASQWYTFSPFWEEDKRSFSE